MLDTQQSRTRFFRSRNDSLTKLRTYQDHRREFIHQMVGKWWGKSNWGIDSENPVNLILKAYQVYLRMLVASAPQVLIMTDKEQYKAIAADAEVVQNRAIERSNVEDMLKRWVGSGMFGLGIMKTGLQQAGMEEDPMTGEMLPYGEVFSQNISLDAWVHDMSARSLDMDELTYMGHRFDMPLDQARENTTFKKKIRNQLVERSTANSGRSGARKVESMGASNKLDVIPMVDLWEYYVPSENMVYVTTDKEEDEPLAQYEWTGPEGGPYDFMYFLEIEDNSMPLPPAAGWMDLHRIINTVYKKEAENAKNAKTNLVYQEGDDEDAQKVVDADNLEAIGVSNPESIRDMHFNGVRPENLAFIVQSLDLANNQMGNLDLMAGLASQSPTAKQDSLLNANASALSKEMVDRVYAKTKSVFEKRCWYYWHDPVRTYQDVRTLPNTKDYVKISLTPEDRAGHWEMFNFDIVPYSMQHRSPEERIAELDGLMMQMAPMLELMMQSGLMFDFEAYLQLRAKYRRMPEILDVIKPMEQPREQQQPIGERTKQAPVTQRNYVRENISGGSTPAAQTSNQVESLMGMMSQ